MRVINTDKHFLARLYVNFKNIKDDNSLCIVLGRRSLGQLTFELFVQISGVVLRKTVSTQDTARREFISGHLTRATHPP